MQTDLIVIREYCDKCHIDPSFIVLLEEGGLIEVREIDHERYITLSQLYDLERYTRWYYDLSINIEGIDAIRHLLVRMEELQREINKMRSRLNIHPIELFDAKDWEEDL